MRSCANCKERDAMKHPDAQGMCNTCFCRLVEHLDQSGIPEALRIEANTKQYSAVGEEGDEGTTAPGDLPNH